jgi:UDP-glucose 4-epimerase
VIVVTGATGFVGRRFVRALEAAGLAARAVGRDRLDLERPERAAEQLAGATTVCHLAAYIPANHADPAHAARCMHVNALGTLALLEASVAVNVRRFVYFSSGNVYLAQPRAVREDDPIYPSARAPYYLASKVCGEIFADHVGRAGKLAVAIARVSSVYGPGMAATGMVPAFAARLRAGEAVTVQDGGRYQTDLVHVDDVVAAAVQLAVRDVRGAINIGSGCAASALEVARTLAELAGRDAQLVRVEPARPGEPPLGFSALDIARATRELGYAPRSLRDGLADYLASLP